MCSIYPPLISIFFLPAAAMTGPLYKAVMEEIPILISDNDLHISQLVLTLLCTVMNVSPESIIEVILFHFSND